MTGGWARQRALPQPDHRRVTESARVTGGEARQQSLPQPVVSSFSSGVRKRGVILTGPPPQAYRSISPSTYASSRSLSTRGVRSVRPSSRHGPASFAASGT